MNAVLGLLALILVGDEGVAATPSYAAPVASLAPGSAFTRRVPESVEFRLYFVEMKSLDWRGLFHHCVQLVAHQGAATVWTTDREVLPDLFKQGTGVWQAPKVTSQPNEPAVLWSQSTKRTFVSHLKRISDAPPGKATYVKVQPEAACLLDGSNVRVLGRKLDQGVLTHVSLDETRFASFHTVNVSDSVRGGGPGGAPTSVNFQYQVPEVIGAKVDGEWLIPNNGALVVSLGVHTFADKDGKAVVCERLAVIEADPFTSTPRPNLPQAALPQPPDVIVPSAAPAPAIQRFVIKLSPTELLLGDHKRITVLPPGPLPIAVPPSPSLPFAGIPNAPAALPPLPDDQVRAASLSEMAEPRPSPQTNLVNVRMKVDSATQRASADAESADESCCGAKNASGWAPVREGTIRIPLGGHLAIEIRARVTPAPASMSNDEPAHGSR